jgi:hypothetical protein
VRDIPASGTYFFTYEAIVNYMIDHNIADRDGMFVHLVAGGFAGVTSWSVIVPLDVVKSQIQSDYSGSLYCNSLEAARTVYQTSGFRGFYTGWLMICVRAFPVNAIILIVYAKSITILNQLW